MTECYECARLAELMAENSQLRVMVDGMTRIDQDERLPRLADAETRVRELQAKLDELTCNDALAPEKVVTPESVGANDANADTREKLEADDMPEGDALTLMRKGFGEMLDALGIDRNEKGHCTKAINVLADMVERDYVSREAYDDLSGEFVWVNTFLHRVGKQCGTKDVPSLKAYVEQLEAKADELKAMNERLQVALDAVEGCDERCMKLESERDELKRKLEVADRHEFESDQMCDECKGYIDEQLAELIAERELYRDNMLAQTRKVDELTAQLESAHAKNRSLRTHISKMQEGRHGWHVKGVELQREVDRLARENVALARDLGECMAERDALRRENAKLSDDEFYLRCTLVDINGEVAG